MKHFLALVLLFSCSLYAAPKHKKKPELRTPPLVSHGLKLSRIRCAYIPFAGSNRYVIYGEAWYGPQHAHEWQHQIGHLEVDRFRFSSGAETTHSVFLTMSQASEHICGLWGKAIEKKEGTAGHQKKPSK
jgi:hypothetical protein